MDPVAERITLPCSCRIAYCSSCWDRALARSFQDAGRARCPTCRSAVRIDFDSCSGRVNFTREARADEADRGTVISRLVLQVKPAQIRALQQFGSVNPELRHIAEGRFDRVGEAASPQLLRRTQELGWGGGTKGSARAILRLLSEKHNLSGAELASLWASGLSSGPSCVCGGRLLHVSGMDRALFSLKHGAPHLPPGSEQYAACLRRITDEGKTCGANCDICGAISLPLREWIWTCESREETILHPAAYDICEGCFMRHAVPTRGAAPGGT